MSVLERPEGITSFLVYLCTLSICAEPRTVLKAGPDSDEVDHWAKMRRDESSAESKVQECLCSYRTSSALLFQGVSISCLICLYRSPPKYDQFLWKWQGPPFLPQLQMESMSTTNFDAAIRCPKWCLTQLQPRVSWPCWDIANGVSEYGRHCKCGCPR